MSAPGDFSFLGAESGLQRKQPSAAAGRPAPQQQQQGGGGDPAAHPGPQARQSPGSIAIPSFRDVQRAERQRPAAGTFFKPSTQGASGSLGAANGSNLAASGARAAAPRGQQPGSTAWQPPNAQQQHPQQAAQVPAQGLPMHRPVLQRYASQQPPPMGLQQPTPPPAQQQFPSNAIIVSKRQDGNPVLKYIRNVRWQFGDIVPDYLLGRETACLFLSLRYHLLKPDYIHGRIRSLQRSYRLRIILCHVDTEDAVEPLAQVTRAAVGNDCTLVCGWSNQECARYLELFKSYENKPAEVIQKDLGTDYLSRINAVLTTVRGINKTDVKTLGDRFGSVAGIFKAAAAEVQASPGIGPTKARRLHDTFHLPFRRSLSAAAAAPASIAAQIAPAASTDKPIEDEADDSLNDSDIDAM